MPNLTASRPVPRPMSPHRRARPAPGDLAGPGRCGSDMAGLAKFHAPEIVFGPGSLAELGHCARRLGTRRPFLVTDEGIAEAGWVAEAVGHLRTVGLRPVVWCGVTPNPKD